MSRAHRQEATGPAPSGLSQSALSQAEPLVPCAAMTDAELLEYATSFRNGLLGAQSSVSMCAAVSWPLAALLRRNGVPCETVESDLSEELGLLYANHIWIRLADGRVLDATADQFNPWGQAHYPPVYLGPPTEIHSAQGMPLVEPSREGGSGASAPASPVLEEDAPSISPSPAAGR